MRHIPIGSWVLVAALGAGCGDKLEAHLGKYMDTGGQQATDFGKPPDVYSLAESDQVADRIQNMTFQEVAQRLGAHRYQAKTDYRFRSPEHFTSLSEQVLIVQAADGDFRVKVDNDSGQGYELLYSGGELFVRTRFGPFHRRSPLDGIHLTQRDAAYGAWAAIYRLYRGRLLFSKLGLARHFGRDALKFSIALADRPARLPGTRPQPAVPAGVGKYVYPIEPTPAEQDRWRDQAAPVRASGTLLVDLDTGAVLKVDFDGQLAWQDPAGQALSLEVSTRIESDGFGNPPSLDPPAAEAVAPLPERIQVDTHPLDFFFGKGFTAGLGAPAGVARKSKAEQDAESKEGDKAPAAN